MHATSPSHSLMCCSVDGRLRSLEIWIVRHVLVGSKQHGRQYAGIPSDLREYYDRVTWSLCYPSSPSPNSGAPAHLRSTVVWAGSVVALICSRPMPPPLLILPVSGKRKSPTLTACSRRYREPTPRSQPLAVDEEQIRERHHNESKESEETSGPLIPKLLIHLDTKQGERSYGTHVSELASARRGQGHGTIQLSDLGRSWWLLVLRGHWRITYQQRCIVQGRCRLGRSRRTAGMRQPTGTISACSHSGQPVAPRPGPACGWVTAALCFPRWPYELVAG